MDYYALKRKHNRYTIKQLGGQLYKYIYHYCLLVIWVGASAIVKVKRSGIV